MTLDDLRKLVIDSAHLPANTKIGIADSMNEFIELDMPQQKRVYPDASVHLVPSGNIAIVFPHVNTDPH